MNEKAAELGCQDSHFANPSGLNNEEHYVSAYDMALITRAAFENPTFAKIVETTYYKLPPNQKNPEGQGISPGNKLVKKNWSQYYRPDVLGGKTGYTSIALNTLVNGARQGDTTLITVILHSNNTQYEDTSRLLDFGFNNFQSVKIADYDQTFSNIGKDLKIADVSTAGVQGCLSEKIIGTLIYIPLALLMLSVSLPLVIHFGAEKGRYIAMVMWAIIFAVVYILIKTIGLSADAVDAWLNGLNWGMVLAGVALFTVIVYMGSFGIGVRLMEKKEF